MSSAAFSAIGTSNGFTSYDETQVTSAYTGSGAISTGVLVISAATSATATAVSATRRASSVVSTTPEANPHEPRWITRTAKPTSSASSAVWSTPSRTARCWCRIRSKRKSAWLAPSSWARPRATAPSSR